MNENDIVIKIGIIFSIFLEMQKISIGMLFLLPSFLEVALAALLYINTQFYTKQSLSVNALSSKYIIMKYFFSFDTIL
jgi:hypothetical protein